MSDWGLYQALENRLSQIPPAVQVFGQIPPEVSPPYIVLQLDPLEKSAPPQKAGRIKACVQIISRYRGETEIQNLHRHVLDVLEGAPLILKEDAAGLVRFEESQVKIEEDGVTRRALLSFTVLIRFGG